MGSKSERIIFSGPEDDFVYFPEQFEARLHLLKLGKVLSGEATHEDCLPTVNKAGKK